MMAAILLDLDDVEFLEPSFDRLLDETYTSMLACVRASEGHLLINEREEPIAAALKDEKGWKACSFTMRRPTDTLFDRLEQIDNEIYQEKQSEWEAAVREYFSLKMMMKVSPSVEDFSTDRKEKLRELVRETWRGEKTGPCLDACCGSGMGSAVLRNIGMLPLAFDNDPSLLSRGLTAGRLLPEQTMWIDAGRASQYLKPVGHGVLLMAGEITRFNSPIWKSITFQTLDLTTRTIITTGTEREARLLEGWCLENGREVRMFENYRDPFYDRWVCDVRKK